MGTPGGHKDVASTVAAVRERVRSGLSLDEALAVLHGEGLSLFECYRAIIQLFGMSLEQAQLAAARHPLWALAAESSRRATAAFFDVLEFSAIREGRKPNQYHHLIAVVSELIGLEPPPEDWSGVDAVLPLLERMRREGAVVTVKMDGERTGPGATPYTCLVSGARLSGELLRADTEDLEEGLAQVIVEYASRHWHVD